MRLDDRPERILEGAPACTNQVPPSSKRPDQSSKHPAQDEDNQEQRVRTRRMVLRMEVDSASRGMVALESRVRSRRPADLVVDPCVWNDETLEASSGGAPAEIRVLILQKGAFVKQSDLLEYLTANEQTTAGYPACLHRDCRCGRKPERRDRTIAPPVERPAEIPRPRSCRAGACGGRDCAKGNRRWAHYGRD